MPLEHQLHVVRPTLGIIVTQIEQAGAMEQFLVDESE